MSMAYMVKAMQCKVGNAARKLVLLKLADHANDKGVCFPSYQHIADQCEISRQSAITHVKALEKAGFLVKHTRKNQDGTTSNWYRLQLEKGSQNTDSEGGQNIRLGGSNNLTGVVKNLDQGVVKNFDPNLVTSFNQSINHKKSTQKKSDAESDVLADFGIDEDLAKDFMEHRKAKKAPITKTVMKGFEREAKKANITLTAALEVAILQNWIGFRADWYENLHKPKGNHQGQKPSVRWNNFGEVDYYKGINPDGSF